MPTYGDEKTISASIESVIQQTEKSWELIISDDASPDNTESVVKTYLKNDSRIKYIKSRKNEDQLNAILKSEKLIRGKYVFILHSDDMFANDEVLEKAKQKLGVNATPPDTIVSDLELINEKSKLIGKQKVKVPTNKDQASSLTLLWLGRNPYIDFAFWQKDVFLTTVTDNYLKWNTPFWLDFNSKKNLKINKVDFPFIKYRVHEENYKNNNLGKFCVLNGELRTAINLMKNYKIPFYCFQYYIFRLFNKLNLQYHPVFLKASTSPKSQYKIIKFIIEKTYPDKNSFPIFFKEYLSFLKYQSQKHTKKTLDLTEYTFKENLLGKDVRHFSRNLFDEKLNCGFEKIIQTLNSGFDVIICKNKDDSEKIENFIKLMNIHNVNLTIKINKKEKQ